MPPRIRQINTRVPEVNAINRIPSGRVLEPLPPPVVTRIPQPVVDFPVGEIPSYEPVQPPSSQIIDVQGVSRPSKDKEEVPAENRVLAPGTTEIQIPYINVSVPVPTARVATLTLTTAITATAAALAAKVIVERAIKWAVKMIKKNLIKLKSKMNRDLTPYELQLFLEYQGPGELKKLRKTLAKEQKEQKAEQAVRFSERPHQNKLPHKES